MCIPAITAFDIAFHNSAKWNKPVPINQHQGHSKSVHLW